MHREITHRTNESNNKLIEPPAPSAAEIIGLEVCVARAFAQSCPNCGGCEARIEPGKAQSYAAIRCLCGQFRGWLTKSTGHWLARQVAMHGRPRLVDIHNGRVLS
jgi:hypothetical protein